MKLNKILLILILTIFLFCIFFLTTKTISQNNYINHLNKMISRKENIIKGYEEIVEDYEKMIYNSPDNKNEYPILNEEEWTAGNKI